MLKTFSMEMSKVGKCLKYLVLPFFLEEANCLEIKLWDYLLKLWDLLTRFSDLCLKLEFPLVLDCWEYHICHLLLSPRGSGSLFAQAAPPLGYKNLQGR